VCGSDHRLREHFDGSVLRGSHLGRGYYLGSRALTNGLLDLDRTIALSSTDMQTA